MIKKVSSRAIFLLILSPWFASAMDCSKKEQKETACAMPVIPLVTLFSEESAKDAVVTHKPIVNLCQDEFDTFTTMIQATMNVATLWLKVIKKRKDDDPESIVRGLFLQYTLLKNRARTEFFIQNQGIAKQECLWVAQFNCNNKKIDRLILRNFVWLWGFFDLDKNLSANIHPLKEGLAMRKKSNDYERDKLIDAICVQDILKITKLLEEKKVDLNSGDMFNHYPLMHAVIFNYPSVAKLLIDSGAWLKCVTPYGTILPMFINEGLSTLKDKKKMNQLLWEITPNFLDEYEGLTPLMWAVRSASKTMVCALLKRNANKLAVAKDGITTAYYLTDTLEDKRGVEIRQLLGEKAMFFELEHHEKLARSRKEKSAQSDKKSTELVNDPIKTGDLSLIPATACPIPITKKQKKEDVQLSANKKERTPEQELQARIMAQKKVKDDKRARKHERKRIAYYRGLAQDFVQDTWNTLTAAYCYCQRLKEQQRAREQFLMQQEDNKMLVLVRVINRFKDKQTKQKYAALADAWEKIKIFVKPSQTEEIRAQDILKRKEQQAQEDVWIVAWQYYRATGIKTRTYIQEERRREQLQRRRSAQDLIDRTTKMAVTAIILSQNRDVPPKKLNAGAREFCMNK